MTTNIGLANKEKTHYAPWNQLTETDIRKMILEELDAYMEKEVLGSFFKGKEKPKAAMTADKVTDSDEVHRAFRKWAGTTKDFNQYADGLWPYTIAELAFNAGWNAHFESQEKTPNKAASDKGMKDHIVYLEDIIQEMDLAINNGNWDRYGDMWERYKNGPRYLDI